jgi:hypothetical protein
VVQVVRQKVTFLLRSPEAIIYYLGELARLGNREDNPKAAYVCVQGRYQPLFVALPAGSCPDSLVDADSGRGKYSIPPIGETLDEDVCDKDTEAGKLVLRKPACDSGRSMQALRLLNQLISLQKSAEDNPATGLVRLID